MSQDSSEKNWKFILSRLQRGKAILLLGPEVIMASRKDPIPLQDALQNEIRDYLDGEDLARFEYYSEDGFFFLEDEYRLEAVEAVLQFYENQAVTDLYSKLAEIPFHLILSLSPDRVLEKAFRQLELPHLFHYYDKKNYNETLDDQKLNFVPTKDKRLIYNVFGSVDNEDSLILSYDDLFEFLQKIFNNHSLPKTVRETILDANCFVFVGFNYGKWYLKLLLRLLNLNNKKLKNYAMDEPARKEVETFFVNEFDMNFTRMNARTFIEELHQKCEVAEILVTKETVSLPKIPNQVYESAKSKISDGKLAQAFDVLTEYCKSETPPDDFEPTLTQISGRFNRIKKENMEGVLRFEEYETETNKVSKALIILLNDFRD